MSDCEQLECGPWTGKRAVLWDTLPPTAQTWMRRAHAAVWHELPGELHYGGILVDDPREYCPDIECCSLDEVERWAEACSRWEAGEPTAQQAYIPGQVCQANYSFGIGVCRYGDEDDGRWDELDGPGDPLVWPMVPA